METNKKSDGDVGILGGDTQLDINVKMLHRLIKTQEEFCICKKFELPVGNNFPSLKRFSVDHMDGSAELHFHRVPKFLIENFSEYSIVFYKSKSPEVEQATVRGSVLMEAKELTYGDRDMMALMKIARFKFNHRDSAVDGAAYLALAHEVLQEIG
jgi:hypothetical protein